YFSQHTHHFLENYYLKSKRSVEKPTLEGPAAYVIAADPADVNRQIELLKVFKRQHVEVQQLTEAATSSLPPAKRGDKPAQQTFPAGSLVIRMDQPYSRVADALLDRQFWAPDDPQKHPYDDTGWSFSHLFNVNVVRVPDVSILKAAMKPVDDPASLAGTVSGSGSITAVANHGQTTLLALLYKLKDAKVEVTEKASDNLPAGSLLISGADSKQLSDALKSL